MPKADSKYHIEATHVDDGQTVDCNNDGVIGDVFDVTYDSLAEACDIADTLQSEMEEYEIDPSTVYHVAEIEVDGRQRGKIYAATMQCKLEKKYDVRLKLRLGLWHIIEAEGSPWMSRPIGSTLHKVEQWLYIHWVEA